MKTKMNLVVALMEDEGLEEELEEGVLKEEEALKVEEALKELIEEELKKEELKEEELKEEQTVAIVMGMMASLTKVTTVVAVTMPSQRPRVSGVLMLLRQETRRWR